MKKKYDAIVIGTGQGGGPLAQAFAQAGKTTLLIEKNFVGGTCINRGCTPTKTLVASAKMAYLTKKAKSFNKHNNYRVRDQFAG